MAIKITDKILSIPPYLSTTWSHISALHMKGAVLAITLTDGDSLQIPNLSSEVIQLIFHYHVLHLEKEQPLSSENLDVQKDESKQEHSIRLAFGPSIENLGNMENMGNIMQHNPEQADAPDLPPEILQKVSAIAKIIEPAEEMSLPQAEPGCNCFHCQLARALSPVETKEEELLNLEEEEVKDEDLQFQKWSITQTGDKLFSVVDPCDEQKKYQVYLGSPVGCTCGEEGCPHILAVLKS